MAIEQELVRDLLSDIVKSKPDIQPSDYKWLIGLLKDLYNPKREIQHSDCIKEINGLANCLLWGIADDIRDSNGKTIESTEGKALIFKLVNLYGLQEVFSRWCIASWCIALNKNIDLDSIGVNHELSNFYSTHTGSDQKINYTEQLFSEIAYDILKVKPLDLNTKFELSVKGKQLKLSEELIKSIIYETKHRLIEENKQKIEKLRIEKERKIIERRNEIDRLNEQQKLANNNRKEQQSLNDLFRIEAEKRRKASGVHLSLGIKHTNSKDYKNAVKELHEAIQIDPNNPVIFFNLGNVYYDLEDYSNAIREYNDAIRLDPNYADAHNNLGHVYYNLKDDNNAIKEYLETIRLNPVEPNAHNYLANIYFTRRDYNNAIREYKEAIKCNPNYAEAHCNLGDIYLEMKYYDNAVQEFREALRIDPNFTNARTGLVQAQKKRQSTKHKI